MSSSPEVHQQQFASPATYRIQVYGPVAAGWSDRLNGLTASFETTADGSPMTTLEGELSSQTALAGVLSALCEMQATLFSVECLSC